MGPTMPQVGRANSPVVGPWQALTLDIGRRRMPGLRVRVAGRGRLLLDQCGLDRYGPDRYGLERGCGLRCGTVLLALVAPDHGGVDYLRTDRFVAPVPPVTAALARSIGPGSDDGAWHARWAHWFATGLAAATSGPLHDGRWVISRLPAGQVVTPLPGNPGVLDWFAARDPGQVLPLRRLASPDDGRVKAYRKQVRDGILAPVLLWWISGLDGYALLDGHDRLVAAHAEGCQPELLALSTAPARRAADDTDDATRRYRRTAERMRRLVDAGTPGAADAMAAVNRRYAAELRAIEAGHGVTRAWPLPGGTRRWAEVACCFAPDWYATVVQP